MRCKSFADHKKSVLPFRCELKEGHEGGHKSQLESWNEHYGPSTHSICFLVDEIDKAIEKNDNSRIILLSNSINSLKSSLDDEILDKTQKSLVMSLLNTINVFRVHSAY